MKNRTGLTRGPDCPPWCAGHIGKPGLNHMSPSANAGQSDSALYPRPVSVDLVSTAGGGAPEVMLIRHMSGDCPAVFLSLADATALAEIADGAGAAELAGAIRATLRLLDQDRTDTTGDDR